jgi:hypothetical protein
MNIAPSGILIEAEDFDDYGGWVLDSQFETQMGSPYLLAHGLGRPVADAVTTIEVADAGDYEVWVRAKDWAPAHHPGRFTLTIYDAVVGAEFGGSGEDWSWESGGKVSLPSGQATLTLHDLTGFEGRCDAIYLSRSGQAPPNIMRSVAPAGPGGGRCAGSPTSRATPATSTWWWSAAASPAVRRR